MRMCLYANKMNASSKFVSLLNMNPEKIYQLQEVQPPPSIYDQFSDKMRVKVKPLIDDLLRKGCVIDADGKITLPNKNTIPNGVQILKYIILPSFFNLEIPKHLHKIKKILQNKKVCVSNATMKLHWIDI